jgi:hypothetical protein
MTRQVALARGGAGSDGGMPRATFRRAVAAEYSRVVILAAKALAALAALYVIALMYVAGQPEIGRASCRERVS